MKAADASRPPGTRRCAGTRPPASAACLPRTRRFALHAKLCNNTPLTWPPWAGRRRAPSLQRSSLVPCSRCWVQARLDRPHPLLSTARRRPPPSLILNPGVEIRDVAFHSAIIMSKPGHLILLLALSPGAAFLIGSPAAAPLGARVLSSGPAALSTLRMCSGSIIVFGATGACGSAVCNALIERDPATSVYAFVRDGSAARALLPPQVKLLLGDMSDASAVANALARSRAKSVFLACGNGQKQVRNEENVIAAAENSGAESVVKLSTASQCLSADSAVGQAHLAVEGRCM